MRYEQKAYNNKTVIKMITQAFSGKKNKPFFPAV